MQGVVVQAGAGRSYLHDGVVGVHCERNPLDHTECPQDECKEGWDGEGVHLAQRLQLSHHYRVKQ